MYLYMMTTKNRFGCGIVHRRVDACVIPPDHDKTAINGLAPSGGFIKECSIMMNDIFDIVKPPLTAE